ncbi:unnamed protein product [Rhizophagus irregularis]|nr:unnamed protein product [Rhizophagus irregularis]CAB5347909.1 unnamed protein product [Rhizophagus irregularis]
MSSQQIQKVRNSKVTKQTSRTTFNAKTRPLELAPLAQRPLPPKSISIPYYYLSSQKSSFEMTNPNNILMGYGASTLLALRPNIQYVEGTEVNDHFYSYSTIMSVDLTEPTTPPAQRLGKRKALRSEHFTKDLFEERSLPQDHEKAKTHREVQCLNCLNNKVWYRKIGDANTTNLWRHVEVHHPEKDPRPNKKAKKLIAEGQNTLDEFVGLI